MVGRVTLSNNEMTQEFPKTRKEAQAIECKKYFTGEPCKRGHVSPRYTSTRQCITCLKEFAYEWRENNPEKYNQIGRSWLDNNKEHCRRLARVRYATTSEGDKSRDRARIWRQRNPDKVRQQTRLRRARKIGNGGTHTLEDIKSILEVQGGRCIECNKNIREKYEVDHILPLSLGGSDSKSNLQLMCTRCNRKKWAIDPFIWANRNGRLL